MVLVAFLSVGCSLHNPFEKIRQKPKQETKIMVKPRPIHKPKPKPIKRKKNVSNMLRGVILSQNYYRSKRLWGYRLKVIDIVNDSLKNVRFFYKKRVFAPGDLVYVLFDRRRKGVAKDIVLIKKSYKKIRKSSKLHVNKFHKRTKARKAPGIGLPKRSTIRLY